MECRIIDGTYKIGKQIGFGGCGVVHEGINMDTGEKIAAKFEEYTKDNLLTEWNAYTALSGTKGIPKVYHYSADNCGYNVLIMELFDKSLEDFFAERNKIPLPQAISLAKQLHSTLHDIHTAGIVHFDVKPANILLRGNQIFIIDFGLACLYTKEQFKGTSVKYFRQHEECVIAGVIMDLLRGENTQKSAVRASV